MTLQKSFDYQVN